MDSHISKTEHHVFEIDESFLQVCGTGTLIGAFVKRFPIERPSKIVLRLFRTSIEWQHKNGGPKLYLIPEYAIPCLLEDLVWFHKNGIEFQIETMERDP